MKKLASSDVAEQTQGQMLADEILEKKSETIISEDCELKVKTDRTLINKCSTDEKKTNEEMSQGK